MRWHLIEKFEILKKGKYSRAVKSYSGEEDFFQEHYPGNPVVPETLFLEMMAQAGGVLYGLGFDFKKEIILAKIADAKFSKTVHPPCSFSIEASIEEEREEGAWILGVVKQGSDVVAEARVMLVSLDSLNNVLEENVVFNDNFLKTFDVYNVARASEGVN